MKKLQTGVLAGCSLAAAVLSAGRAQAATVYTTGFQTSEGYTPGNLVGQTGGTPPYQYAEAPNPGAPTDITAAISNGGGAVVTATSLSANTGGMGDAALFFPSIPVGTVNTGATPAVAVSATVAVTSSVDTPGFGFQVYNATTPTESVIFSVFELGDGTIDYQGTGAAVNPSTVFTGSTALGVFLNYGTGGYVLSVNGSQFATGSFDNSAGFGNTGLAAGTFDNTAGSTGTGTFTNFTVTTVPEPTTASLVVGGLAAAGLRRRRRAIAR